MSGRARLLLVLLGLAALAVAGTRAQCTDPDPPAMLLDVDASGLSGGTLSLQFDGSAAYTSVAFRYLADAGHEVACDAAVTFAGATVTGDACPRTFTASALVTDALRECGFEGPSAADAEGFAQYSALAEVTASWSTGAAVFGVPVERTARWQYRVAVRLPSAVEVEASALAYGSVIAQAAVVRREVNSATGVVTLRAVTAVQYPYLLEEPAAAVSGAAGWTAGPVTVSSTDCGAADGETIDPPGPAPAVLLWDEDTFGPQSPDDTWVNRNQGGNTYTQSTSFSGSSSGYSPGSWALMFENNPWTGGLNSGGDANFEPGQTAAGYQLDDFPYICLAYYIPTGTNVNMLLMTNVPSSGTWYSVAMSSNPAYPGYRRDGSWPARASFNIDGQLLRDQWEHRCVNVREQFDTELTSGAVNIDGMLLHSAGYSGESYGITPVYLDSVRVSSANIEHGTTVLYHDEDAFEGATTEGWVAHHGGAAPQLQSLVVMSGAGALLLPDARGLNQPESATLAHGSYWAQPVSYDAADYPWLCAGLAVPSGTRANMLVQTGGAWRSVTLSAGESWTAHPKVASWNDPEPVPQDGRFYYRCINLHAQMVATDGSASDKVITGIAWGDGEGAGGTTAGGPLYLDEFRVSTHDLSADVSSGPVGSCSREAGQRCDLCFQTWTWEVTPDSDEVCELDADHSLQFQVGCQLDDTLSCDTPDQLDAPFTFRTESDSTCAAVVEVASVEPLLRLYAGEDDRDAAGATSTDLVFGNTVFARVDVSPEGGISIEHTALDRVVITSDCAGSCTRDVVPWTAGGVANSYDARIGFQAEANPDTKTGPDDAHLFQFDLGPESVHFDDDQVTGQVLVSVSAQLTVTYRDASGQRLTRRVEVAAADASPRSVSTSSTAVVRASSGDAGQATPSSSSSSSSSPLPLAGVAAVGVAAVALVAAVVGLRRRRSRSRAARGAAKRGSSTSSLGRTSSVAAAAAVALEVAPAPAAPTASLHDVRDLYT